MEAIKLNDILGLKSLDNIKIRFILMVEDNWNPVKLIKSENVHKLLEGQYWNYTKNKSYKIGQTTIGFVRMNNTENLWLLFHVGIITKDLNIFNGVGYEHEILDNYSKYFGRLIIKYDNKSQNLVRNAESVIDDCEVMQILPDTFDNDIFPGYDKVNISWNDLSFVIEKESWKTALQNQKGVYLITDISNGKLYVGSACGENMLLGRWQSYIKTCHGSNIELKNLDSEYIKTNFRYSILDIFKSTVDDRIIIERESWWKEVLQTRKFEPVLKIV
jgi:hypothetical protein